MAFACLMTGQTAFARLLFTQRCKSDNLCGVAARVNVSLARTMARLASLPLRTFMLPCLRSPVRPAIIARRLRLVAWLASIRAHVQRRIRRLEYRILLGFVGKQSTRDREDGKANCDSCSPLQVAQWHKPQS